MNNENRTVVTFDEQDILTEWTKKNHKLFKINSNASGYLCTVNEIININDDNKNNEEILKIINNIRDRIIDKEKLIKYKSCEGLPDLIYYMEPGSKLHIHNDSGFKTSNDGIQIRFNVCIKKPEEGGLPIYAGKVIDLKEREYIICRAEIDYHESDWIKGNEPKISISYGFIVDNSDIHLFSNRENIIINNDNLNNIETYKINNYNLIDIIPSEFNIEYNKKYILNNKNIFNSNFENFIYQQVKYLLKEKLFNFNSNIHTVDFEICNIRNKKFSIEFNKVNKNYPLSTAIIYLNDNKNYLILSDINLESYKYKEIPNNNIFYLSLPKSNNIVSFDSSKYYGFLNLNNNEDENNNSLLYLIINVWDKYPNNIDIYKHINIDEKTNNINLDIEKIENSKNINNYSIFNNNIIETLLYGNYINDITIHNNIKDIIDKNSNSQIIKIENKILNNIINYDNLYSKYGDITIDLLPLLNKSPLINSNRFYNSKIITNVLSKDVCYWIINECEKLNEWDDSNKLLLNYDNYINIEKIPSVANFILFSANFYLFQLKKSYNINENINLNISDIFITKYDNNKKIIYNKNIDISLFTINIQLNDTNDFEGGEIYFSDDNNLCINFDFDISNNNLKINNKILLKQGDMLIYNSFKKRSNGGVKSGEKYVLVLLINIEV